MADNWYKKQAKFMEEQERLHNERVLAERRRFLDRYNELQNQGRWGEIEVDYLNKANGSSGMVGYFSEDHFLNNGGNLCIMDNGELKLVSFFTGESTDFEGEKVGDISRVLSEEASRKALGLERFKV